jgi:lipopolysaccharide transport system permease protein
MAQPIIIAAGQAEQRYWADLWHYRELFGFLAWRDILVRYKQTTIGIAWAVLRPLLTLLMGTAIFGNLAGLDYQGVPAAVSICAATLPWYFFSTALSESASSLVGNSHLISKVYFPRIILPASSIFVALVDFVISLVILVGLMAWYQVWPSWRLVTLPLFTALAIFCAMGPGLLFTALNVKYRDFRYIIPFIVQIGLFITPVFYTTAEVQQKWGNIGRSLISLNPIVAVIDGFRWAICGTASFHWSSFFLSCALGLGCLTLGVWYFRKTERTFADVI